LAAHIDSACRELPVKRTQTSLFLAVLLIGLLIRISVLSLGSEQLIKVVPDDAFYYLETAKHIAGGDGSTFDGANPTNGYHPLWMVLVLPIVILFTDPWWVTRLTLLFGIAFNVGTAVLLFAALHRWLNAWYVPVIGAAIYFLNARSLVSSLNGLETMVSSFFFAASLYLIFWKREQPGFSLKHTVLVGLSLGLLFLARTDNAFYIAVFYGMSLWWQAPAERLKTGVISAVVMALVASPWMLWNYFTFGGFVQSSGFAVPYVLRETFLAEGHSSFELIAESLKIFLTFIGYQVYRFYLGFHFPVFASVLVGTIYFAWRRWKTIDDSESKSSRRFVQLLIGLGSAAVALIFVHTFLRWYPRTYYFDQIIILCAVGCCVGLTLIRPTKVLEKMPVRVPALLSVAVLLGMISLPAVYSGYKLHTRGQYPHQIEFLDAARWLEQNTEEGDVIAGFNVGITSFFSERDVVNLDGAINMAAFEAIKGRRLFAYAEDLKVRYIVDYDPVMFEMYRYFLGTSSPGFTKTIIVDIDRPDVDWVESHIRVFDMGYRTGLAIKDDSE
jgi:4-amino-4-deoxy-L-arabinose transferase-like glycosyltransferase